MQRATVQWRLPPEYLDPAAGLAFFNISLFACRQRYQSSTTPRTGAPAADAIRSSIETWEATVERQRRTPGGFSCICRLQCMANGQNAADADGGFDPQIAVPGENEEAVEERI
ncbi:hypothetical protein Trihar35433_8713 [Trichoderma harzianum]|nr:hypothetical protein Trihar35433_8713 [Trichoderma harzianum]